MSSEDSELEGEPQRPTRSPSYPTPPQWTPWFFWAALINGTVMTLQAANQWYQLVRALLGHPIFGPTSPAQTILSALACVGWSAWATGFIWLAVRHRRTTRTAATIDDGR